MKNPLRSIKSKPVVASEGELIQKMLLPETSKEIFFMLYARLVELRLKPTELTYEEPGTLHMTKQDGGSYVLYLDNLWIICCDDRDGGAETIERYLALAEGLGKKVQADRELIIPWVKDQAYVDLLGLNTDIAHQHLAADLWIVYATHGKGGSSSITNREIAELGINTEELLILAIENLKRILPAIEREDFGSWSLLWAGGDYVPSVLLFDDFWDRTAKEMDGDLIVVAPVSDSIFFTSTTSSAGLLHIRKRALALRAEGHHIVSSTLLRRVPGGWKVFD